MIHGHVLDFGCGKCAEVNARVLNTAPGIGSVTSYDPFYAPDALVRSKRKKFDVVLCNYVLCTLPKSEELLVLKTIQPYLSDSGIALISVRNDVPRGGYGLSSKGTYQRRVEIEYLYELRKCTQYRIYVLTRDCKLV